VLQITAGRVWAAGQCAHRRGDSSPGRRWRWWRWDRSATWGRRLRHRSSDWPQHPADPLRPGVGGAGDRTGPSGRGARHRDCFAAT